MAKAHVIVGLVICVAAVSLGGTIPAWAATFSIGAQQASNYEDAQVVSAPRPEIPQELVEQGIKSSCVAKFQIKEDGKFSVNLVNSSGSQEVDDIALSTLKQWKFRAAMVDGKPIASSRKIRVEFEFE